MPNSGSNSGNTFSTSQEPPGRSGASHNSQATRQQDQAIRLAEATTCRIRRQTRAGITTAPACAKATRAAGLFRIGTDVAEIEAQQLLIGAHIEAVRIDADHLRAGGGDSMHMPAVSAQIVRMIVIHVRQDVGSPDALSALPGDRYCAGSTQWIRPKPPM
jgi:hypothetical protein